MKRTTAPPGHRAHEDYSYKTVAVTDPPGLRVKTTIAVGRSHMKQ